MRSLSGADPAPPDGSHRSFCQNPLGPMDSLSTNQVTCLERSLGCLAKKMAKKKSKRSKAPQARIKSLTSDKADARSLIAVVEKSQVPFGESAPIFAELKDKVEKGEALSVEQHERLLNLVKIAREWERGVENSASTDPDETLSG